VDHVEWTMWLMGGLIAKARLTCLATSAINSCQPVARHDSGFPKFVLALFQPAGFVTSCRSLRLSHTDRLAFVLSSLFGTETKMRVPERGLAAREACSGIVGDLARRLGPLFRVTDSCD
jgi:hypothetical protein